MLLTMVTAAARQLLRLSLAAVPVLLVLFLVRRLLRRAPKRFSYALWGIAAFRLLCPVELFSSVFSIFNLTGVSRGVAAAQTAADTAFSRQSVTTAASSGVSQSVYRTTVVTQSATAQSTHPALTGAELLALLWLAGVVVLLALLAVQTLRLCRNTRLAVRLEKGVWLCDQIPSPFALGLLRPRIYLPWGLSEREQDYVLAHERTHIRRGDLWWKALGTAVLVLHWWNPLVWLAYDAFTRDLEMSCDEAVLRQLGEGNEQDYSRTLLALAVNRKDFGPALAFGKPAVKERIQNALSFRRAGRGVLALSLATLLIAGLCCCTGAVAGSGSDSAGSELRDRAERLCALRTSDIGDSSAVIALVNVTTGQDWAYSKLSFQTDESPYGLTLLMASGQDFTENDAYLLGTELLAAIENADYCTFQVYDEDWKEYTVERTAAEELLAVESLWSCSESADSMAELLTRLETGTEQESAADTTAERLYALQTPYIGDNSAVTALAAEVTGGAYEKLALQTDTEPYGLTVTLAEGTEPSAGTINAWCTELLALIGNAGYCSIETDTQIFTLERADVSDQLEGLQPGHLSAEDIAELLTGLEADAEQLDAYASQENAALAQENAARGTSAYDVLFTEMGDAITGKAVNEHYSTEIPPDFQSLEPEEEEPYEDLRLSYGDNEGTVIMSWISSYDDAMSLRESTLADHPERALNADSYETLELSLIPSGGELRCMTDGATFLNGYIVWEDSCAVWVSGDYTGAGGWEDFQAALLNVVSSTTRDVSDAAEDGQKEMSWVLGDAAAEAEQTEENSGAAAEAVASADS